MIWPTIINKPIFQTIFPNQKKTNNEPKLLAKFIAFATMVALTIGVPRKLVPAITKKNRSLGQTYHRRNQVIETAQCQTNEISDYLNNIKNKTNQYHELNSVLVKLDA